MNERTREQEATNAELRAEIGEHERTGRRLTALALAADRRPAVFHS